MIKLFDADATVYDSMGLGSLMDCTSCTVTEEINGSYELSMTYPVTGTHYNDLELRRIIYAQASDSSGYQPFRIYKISKPISGLVVVSAQHISYDMSDMAAYPLYYDGDPTTPIPYYKCANALEAIKTSYQKLYGSAIPFTISAGSTFRDIDTWDENAMFTIKKPSSIKSLLGDSDGILNYWKGEWKFDGHTATLYQKRGEDRGVHIRYGKNLTDMTQDENIQSMYTQIYTYWQSDNDGYCDLTTKGSFNYKGQYSSTTTYTTNDCVWMPSSISTYGRKRYFISNFEEHAVTSEDTDTSLQDSSGKWVQKFKGKEPGTEDGQNYWTEVTGWVYDGNSKWKCYKDDDSNTVLGTWTNSARMIHVGDDSVTYDWQKTYICAASSSGGGNSGMPTNPATMLAAAGEYMRENDITKPSVDMTVSFITLKNLAENDPDTANIRSLETINLGDTVHVIFPKLKVETEAECDKTEFNCITGRYESIHLGDVSTSLSSTIASAAASANEAVTEADLRTIGEDIVTGKIMSGLGGYVVMHRSYAADTKTGLPDEILIMDTPNIETASSVIRMNKNGIAFSNDNGYPGPYTSGWSIDGMFYVPETMTGYLNCNYIRGGTLRLGGSTSAYTTTDSSGTVRTWNVGDGAIYMYNSNNLIFGYWDKTGFYLQTPSSSTGGTKVVSLLADGNASFKGNIEATSGTFTGTITSANIYASYIANSSTNPTFYLNGSTGVIYGSTINGSSISGSTISGSTYKSIYYIDGEIETGVLIQGGTKSIICYGYYSEDIPIRDLTVNNSGIYFNMDNNIQCKITADENENGQYGIHVSPYLSASSLTASYVGASWSAIDAMYCDSINISNPLLESFNANWTITPQYTGYNSETGVYIGNLNFGAGDITASYGAYTAATTGNPVSNARLVAAINRCDGIYGSDERIKKDIASLDDITDMYMELNPVTFRMDAKCESDDVRFGLVAQELTSTLEKYGYPEEDTHLVHKYEIDKANYNERVDEDWIYHINYNELHAWHVAMIQKLQNEVKELKEIINNGDSE